MTPLSLARYTATQDQSPWLVHIGIFEICVEGKAYYRDGEDNRRNVTALKGMPGPAHLPDALPFDDLVAQDDYQKGRPQIQKDH